MSEFDLIRRHFTRATPNALLGVGDDCALLQVGEGKVLAVSTDMLVSGTHFFADADPYLLGHKTLAVNLSDMAAMGALPRWATLALSLPYGQSISYSLPHPNPLPEGEGTNDALREIKIDDAWLEQFSAGFFALARQYNVDLVGGDTTRGPLNLCVTLMGEVSAQQALRRDGAKAGDEIWVSGKLGDAALALAHLQGKVQLSDADFVACAMVLHQPQPRVSLGLALRGIASSAIDISDGLLADLGHILDASSVGAQLEFADMPVSAVLKGRGAFAQHCVLAGGDDYELCFTAAAHHHDELLCLERELNLPLTRIGKVVAGTGCVVHDAHGATIQLESGGYEHF
ncbi:MAG: thiamine-phosphate kinase [Gallionella sp.]|jgi:thiamine-monophosphate kinase|nr:thiamine-phosphate kinase [Gallionella sp.]